MPAMLEGITGEAGASYPVDILDDFWAPRMEVKTAISIWHCFKKMEEFEILVLTDRSGCLYVGQASRSQA
jgi:hypothetical protein